VSYAIAEVIYGIPVTNSVFAKILKEVKIEDIPKEFLAELGASDSDPFTMQDVIDVLEDDDELFEVRYSGNADETPRFLGVALCQFDEVNHVKLTDLQTSPDAGQSETARERLEKLPEVLRGYFQPFEVYIFWSTS
jgi:hypothetical protein